MLNRDQFLATIEAIKLITIARRKCYNDAPQSVWDLLHDAERHLGAQVRSYLVGGS